MRHNQLSPARRGAAYRAYQVALAAGAICGLALLGGCGDSPTAAANKNAASSSDAAARLVASAGDWRPSEKLTKEIGEVSMSTAEANEANILANLKKNWKDYIVRRTALDDLKLASDLLQKSAGDAPPSDMLGAVVQAQQASVECQQAEIQLLQVQDSLSDLATRATEIEGLAQRIALEGSLADTAEHRKETNSPTVDKMLGEANGTLERARTTAAAKAQAAKALDEDISKRRSDAQQLYAKSQAALVEADAGKGQDSITAYKAALDVKAQADKLTGEVAVLTPQSQAANADALIADIALKEAEETVRVLTTASERATARAKSGDMEATALRAQATAGLGGEAAGGGDSQGGLTALVKAFKAQSEQISVDAGKARTLAADAASKFQKAGGLFSTATSGTGDPLDKQMQAMLQIGQAAANYRAGAASITDWAAAGLQKSVAESVRLAYAAGRSNGEPLPETTARAAKAMKEAEDSFKDANDELDRALTMVPDTSAPKWLGYSLKAVVNDGLALVSGSPEARQAAKAAAQDAMKRNPSLPLGAFTAE